MKETPWIGKLCETLGKDVVKQKARGLANSASVGQPLVVVYVTITADIPPAP